MSEQPEEKNEKKEEELSPEQEDKKEIYDAIKELKKEDANDNIKSKLVLMTDVYLEQKKVERENFGKEYDVLTDKYDKKYNDIYEKIDKIVKSTDNIEITAEEKEKYGIGDDGENKEIEDFWEKVIVNSRYFTITEKDKAIIKYLKNVKMVKLAQSGESKDASINDFKVEFTFKENEYFTPEILTKTYKYDKDAVLKSAEGTEINWKSEEKNPTINKVKKKVKKGKKFHEITKNEKVDCFFAFFSQTKDMNFLTDEVTFFKEDLFVNQLEYYLDIVSKTKHGANSEEDDDLEAEGGEEKKDEGSEKKEECKQQ